MVGIPEELRRRILSARAIALGEAGDPIPATSVVDTAPEVLPDGVASIGGDATEIPADVIDRVKEARASALAGLGPAPERTTVPKENVPSVTPEPLPIAATPSSPTPASAPAAELTPEPVAEPATEPPAAVAAAPVVSAGMSVEEAAAALGMPEKLLRRSVEAKAKASGVSEDQVLAGMLADAGVASTPPAAPAPVAASEPAAVATPEVAAAEAAPTPAAAPAVAAAPVVSAGMSVEEAAAALGMPEKLFRRSVEAKAKASGVSEDQVLAGMLADAGVALAPAPAAPTAPAAATAPAEAAPTAPAEASAPAAPAAPAVPAEAPAPAPEPAPQQPTGLVESRQLFRVESVTAIISLVILSLLALAGPAPIFVQAGGVADPSKAPWFLVWVEQLLAWMPRTVAAFFVPAAIIVGLFAVPFLDRSSSKLPSRFARALFSVFVLGMIVLIVIGLIGRPTHFGWPWS